jgi:hypothetical protein
MPHGPATPNACGALAPRAVALDHPEQVTLGRQLPETAGLLRLALTELVTGAGTRRALPKLMHVGTPGVEEVVLREEPGLDPGLRADLVERALDGLALEFSPIPWLTRTGDLSPGDADLAWFAATREAFGRHSLVLPGFFVMTRYGWLNLANDELIRWSRVRPAKSDDT